MTGKIVSFFAGLLLSGIFSVIVAIIVGLLWKGKSSKAYWIGAFLGLIMFVIVLVTIGLLAVITNLFHS